MADDLLHKPMTLPIILGGGLLVIILAMKGGGSSGPTVVGAVSASDIVGQNEAVNADAAQVEEAAIGAASNYYTTRDNNSTAVREAVINGGNAKDIAALTTAGNAQLATIQANENLISGSTAAKTAVTLAQIQQGTTEYANQIQGQVGLAQAANQSNESLQQEIATTSVASTNANAAVKQTQITAQTAQTVSNNNFWGGIINSLIGGAATVFGGKSSGVPTFTGPTENVPGSTSLAEPQLTPLAIPTLAFSPQLG